MEETEFDPEVMAPIEGLIHLGDIRNDNIEFAGHTFGLRTLTAAEDIAAAAVIQPFRNTLKEPEAWASAQVGLALTHVDGDEDFCPNVGPNQQSFARARMNYITTNWHFIVIDHLFREYAKLLEQQAEKVRQVQDLSAGSLLTSWPSEDSFSAPGTSNAATALGTPETP